MSMKPDGSIHKGSATLGRRFKKFFTPPKADKTMPAPRIWPHESDPEEDLSFCIKRSPLDENIAKLQSAEKRVFVSLNFFNTTIQKKILSMLAGSATDLLNEVIDLFSELSHLSICPYSEQSSTLMSSHNQVYQSLAALIRWSDYLLIHDQINEDKACLNDITEAVKNGIKNLVKLSIQKLKDKDKESKKGPHSSNTLKVENSNRQHRTSLPEIPLSPKEKEILESTAPLSQSTDDLVVHTDDTPPPKPPLPNDRWSHPNILSDGNTIAVIPPDLPSKKRLSVPLITSASLTPPHSPQNLTKINGYPSPYDNIQRLHYGPHVRTINTGQPVVPNSTSFDNVDGDYADLDPSYSPQSVQHGSRKMHVVEESRYQMNQCSVEIKESSSCQMNRSSSCQIKQSSSYQSTMHSVQHSSFQSHGVVQAQTMNKNICQDPNSYNCTQQPDNNVTKETGKPIVRQISHYDNLNKLDVDGEPPPLPLKHTINTYLNVFKGYTEPATEQIQISQKRTYTTEMEAHYIEYFAPSPPPIPPKKRDSQEIGRLRPKTSPEKTTYWEAGNSDHKSHSMIETGACANLPAISSHQFNKENTALSGSDADRNESKSDTEEKTLDLLDVRHLLIPKKPTEDGPDVRGGSVEALIVHAAGAGKDFVFREAFLTTYRTFISPEELINKLLYRYDKFRPMADVKYKRASKNAFFLLLRVADELIGRIEDDIIEILTDLVFKLLCDGELYLAKVLRDKLLIRIKNKKNEVKVSQPLSSLVVHLKRDSLTDFSAPELAEQMTILDAKLFQSIEIPEVLLWAKEQSEELSPNLTIFTDHFNKMSYWCRSVILIQEKAQDREKLVGKFIKIMKHLRRLNNFNSYLAILSALDSAPVRRLEWQRQTAADLHEYCTLIDSSSSFKIYRAALADAEPPCIPYLGLILQDITFINLGNPDKLDDDGNINFSKCWQQYNILDEMRRFKTHHYSNLKENSKILAFFNDFHDFLDEEAMWQLSEKIKPRGSKHKDFL